MFNIRNEQTVVESNETFFRSSFSLDIKHPIFTRMI